MNNNLEEKTTTEDEGEKDKNANQNEQKPEPENEIRSRLRKNPKKTVLLYSQEDLNKYEKKKNKTDLNDDELNLMKSIIEKLKFHPKSLYFKNPAVRQLDTKKLKEEYKAIIPHPMDLGTSLRKVNKNKYNTFQEFYDDLNLIWDNAQIYNESGSEVYEHAEFMRGYMEEIFKENDLDDKVIHKERKNINDDNKEKETPNDANQKEDEEKHKENEKDKEADSCEKIEINMDKEESNKTMIGKKRKYKKHKNKIKDEENDKKNNEEESTPVIDIKKSEEVQDSLETKSPENSTNSKKRIKTKYLSSASQFKKSKIHKNLNDNYEGNLENLKKLQEKTTKKNKEKKALKESQETDKDKSQEKEIKEEESNENNESSELSENKSNKEDQKDNLKKELNTNENNQNNNINNENKNMNNSSDQVNSCNNEENNIENKNNMNNCNKGENVDNNIVPKIENNDEKQYKTEDILNKQEENNWTEEKIKIYAHKIAKRLDKLPDEDMFNLLEYIESIRPQAIVDKGDYINIDMTMFKGETYSLVYNYIENMIFRNSIIY